MTKFDTVDQVRDPEENVLRFANEWGTSRRNTLDQLEIYVCLSQGLTGQYLSKCTYNLTLLTVYFRILAIPSIRYAARLLLHYYFIDTMLSALEWPLPKSNHT
jgi:hypothetical protein